MKVPEAVRFWTKVRIEQNGCWTWLAAKATGGYGQFCRDGRRSILAHRWAFIELRGSIAEGLTIDHLCRNRACVNPWHMEIVTRRENVLRGTGPSAINARRTHCSHGHLLDGNNVYRSPNAIRRRACIACHNARRRKQAKKP